MVKCLSSTMRLEFHTSEPILNRTKQKAMHEIYACNPSTWEGKTGRPHELHGQTSWPTWLVPGQGDNFPPKPK